MCAFAPVELADVVCRIVHTCDSREDGALRQISFRLVEHYPIFGGEEWHAIQYAWQKLENKVEGATEPIETAECYFFTNLLRALNQSDQIQNLLERPRSAIDLLSFENRFKAPTNWDEIRSQLQNASDEVTIRRLLWFISAHAENVSEDLIGKVAECSAHQHGRVRSTAL
jgi:hypothetical protein